MSETRSITVTLPADLVDALHARVEAGEYANESEAVRAALEGLDHEFMPSDEWLMKEVLPVIEACEADPARLLPADEVFGRLEERYRRDVRERGRAI